MKRIIAIVLAILTVACLVFPVAAATESGHGKKCTNCAKAGDLDQNGVFELEDAVYLLYHTYFPERYALPAHGDHREENCQGCLEAGDLDQNGVLNADDAVRLLYHLNFPEAYPLPGCTYGFKLSMGYARVEITPEDTMDIYGSTATSAHDPLQMTCTAVDDGASRALLFSLDMRSFSVELTGLLTDIIEDQFAIPADHVFFNITHTHSAPSSPNLSHSANGAHGRWRTKICNRLKEVVALALDDLDEVEAAYAGVGYTDGITFVRRYLMKDGTYQTNPGSGAVAHETEADNQMRTLRFDRKNKKDILMVNYQTHYGSATGLYKGQYSADFVHVFRETAERKWDCHFVYHSGASGNLNFASVIPGERKYSNFVAATQLGLIPTAKHCMENEKKITLGGLQFASDWVTAPVYQDTPEDQAKAKEVKKIADANDYDTDSAEYKALCVERGFAGYRQVQGILTRSSLGKTLDVPFYAISFGDIGFVSAPYEMFDTNGQQVRNGSPFEMTFVCSYTNGGFGYVPSSIAFPHGAYEVWISRFCETTGDDFAGEMIRLLKECKAASVS